MRWNLPHSLACNPPANNVSALIVDTSGGLITPGPPNPAFVNGSCACETAQLEETFYNPLNYGGSTYVFICINQARTGVDFTNFCACSTDGTCYKFQSAQEANVYVEAIPVVALCNTDGSGKLTCSLKFKGLNRGMLAPSWGLVEPNSGLLGPCGAEFRSPRAL